MCFSFQLSFQMWTDQMQESLNSKKKGDAAFRQKEFSTAIECYTQVNSPVHLFIYLQMETTHVDHSTIVVFLYFAPLYSTNFLF